MWKTKTTCVHVDLPHSREGLLEQKLEVSFVMKEEELHKITILHISNVIQYQSKVRYHPFTRHLYLIIGYTILLVHHMICILVTRLL